MQDTLRAFVALILPPDCIEYLARQQEELKAHGLKMSWVKPDNLHVTLKFLGDIQGAELPPVVAVLHQTAANCPPLNLVVQGAGVFPGIKRPRVLWTGIGGDTDQLRSLFADLEAGLEGLSIARDKRAFKAHITLARIRKRVDPSRLIKAIENVGRLPAQRFVARRLVLFKSDLQPRGAVYTPLAEAVMA